MFVAEVSSNHNRDLQRCLEFVDKAAEIGCDAIKFQLFKIDELFAPEVLSQRADLRERKKWELPLEFVPVIAEHCNDKNILFSCTPFYLDAVEQLFPFVNFYKIASYELLWNDLLKLCAQTGKPVVLSTGMATMQEVNSAVEILRTFGCENLTLLHCVSGYPTPTAECNLAAIDTIRRACNCSVGWSDHSVKPEVIYRAVHRWDASMIEFHMDIEGRGGEFDIGHCWLPEQMGIVIKTIREGLRADGNGEKAPVPCELIDRDWRADPDDGLRPIKKIRFNTML
jgi:N-acetylneuraminate synthase